MVPRCFGGFDGGKKNKMADIPGGGEKKCTHCMSKYKNIYSKDSHSGGADRSLDL